MNGKAGADARPLSPFPFTAVLQSLYADEEGYLPATFQVFYLIGWSPHESQAKPAARGSASVKIGDISALPDASEQQQQQQGEEQAAPFQLREE